MAGGRVMAVDSSPLSDVPLMCFGFTKAECGVQGRLGLPGMSELQATKSQWQLTMQRVAASSMGCSSCSISGRLPWHLCPRVGETKGERRLPGQVRSGTAVVADVAFAEQTQGRALQVVRPWIHRLIPDSALRLEQ